MKFSREDLAEFKDIWIRHGYKYESDQQLLEAAGRLTNLMRVLSKPIPNARQEEISNTGVKHVGESNS